MDATSEKKQPKTRLHYHIADYQKVLDDEEGYAPRALLRLQYDPLVHVITFLRRDVLASIVHTLGAVSPQMRLDAETLAWTPNTEEEQISAVVRFEWLHCRLRATAEMPESPKFAHLTWWASRCGLPLDITVNNARSDVLALLAEGLELQVKMLNVELTTVPVCVEEGAPACDGQCGSILCALPTFPNLKKLSIKCNEFKDGQRASAYVARVLRTAAQLPIGEVNISYVPQLGNFAALSGAQHLRSLTAKSCGITSVSELLSCPNLTTLDVSDNAELEDVSCLVRAQRLEVLRLLGCNLQTLDGLGSCPNLRELNASFNERLESTRGLAGAPSLKTLSVGHNQELRSLEGLNMCPLLENLDVECCEYLEDFRDLAGAPSLRSLNALGSGLQSLEGLSSSPLLESIDIVENLGVRDVSGLAGAPSLRFFDAVDTGLRHVAGLGSCPQLVEVKFDACEYLEDISGLAGAPSLERISAVNCRIHNINGLGRCPRLRELELDGSKPLTDVRELSRCRSLKYLCLYSTSVKDTHFLDPSVDVRM